MKRKSRETLTSSPNKRGSETKKHRFFIVAAVFVIMSMVFCSVMGITQLTGSVEEDPDKNLDVRSETVAGERGRIYDRNGVLLVDNKTEYDLIFEYGAMGYTSAEVNRALLDCIEILNSTGNADKRAVDYFPLSGTYPQMTLHPEAMDKNSDIGYYYNRFLVRSKLKADSTADDIVEYFVQNHLLKDKGYSNQEITELIRLHYDKDRVGFGSYQNYTIAQGFDPENPNHMSLITRIKEQQIEGANLIKPKGRIYLYEGYASHILGALGKITAENRKDYEDYPLDSLVGISGVEYAFEEYLRGSDGKKITKYDREGNLVEQYYDPAPIMGNDVYLTIDINLQIAAEDGLAEEIESLEHSEAGAITASDPSTGEVLVLASYPTYEISPFNRALQGTYAPGSTYKVGSALAALEENHINAATLYDCQQVYPHLGGPTCLGLHGNLNVSDAIRVSCNIFFYYVGEEMGIERITPYTKKLGLGVPTGIELGEKTGVITSEKYALQNELSWSASDDATGAIGQSTHLYTPMQLSVYMSSIVNHGTRYSAHLLKKVQTKTGELVFEKQPEVLDTLEFSQSTYDTLISAMHSVVSTNESLSSYFGSVGVEVGGKTGTAQTGRKYDNGLFCGFAPLNEPKIVASCVLEQGEAGSNAAKVVADVFNEYFNPTPKEEEETEEGETE